MKRPKQGHGTSDPSARSRTPGGRGMVRSSGNPNSGSQSAAGNRRRSGQQSGQQAASVSKSRSRETKTPVDVEQVAKQIQPLGASLGLIVEEVEVRTAPLTLEIVIDKAEGTEPVSLQEVADFSRLASGWLDEHDPLPGAYLLEVTTRGAEALLEHRRHYLRNLGRTIRVTLADERVLTGVLREVREVDFSLATEGIQEVQWVPFEQVVRAHPIALLTGKTIEEGES